MTFRGGGRVRGGAAVDMGRFRYAEGWTDKIDAALRPRMKRAVEVGFIAATAVVPVRTGKLRDSIDRNVQRRGKFLEGRLSVGTDYWQYVEYGTGNRGASTNPASLVQSQGYSYSSVAGLPARPFMRPGLVAMRDAFVNS